MDLIKNFYKKDKDMVVSNLDINHEDVEDIIYWLKNMRFYDDDIDYSRFNLNLLKICNELGISDMNLLKFRGNKTRFNNDSFYKIGSFSFNYSDSDKVDRKNVITCYGCNELVLYNWNNSNS